MNTQTKSSFGPHDDRMVVRFAPVGGSLPAMQQAILRPWVEAWIGRRPNASLVMACDGSHAREVREERLRSLRETLVAFGVPGERVRYTADAVDLTGDAPAPERGVAACLQIVSSQSLDSMVMPIRQLLQPRAGGEVRCSGTS